jgi:hypothetical protein
MILPKSFLLYILVIYPGIRLGDIRKVNITTCSVLILPKHGVDCCTKLDRILLIDIVGIHLEIFESIDCGLIRVELYFPLSSLAHSLAHARADLDILKDGLFFSPGIREYYINRDITGSRFAKNDLTVRFMLQEVYESYK